MPADKTSTTDLTTEYHLFHHYQGVELRIWLKQGKEKSLLAKVLKILEEARKRLSPKNRQKRT